MLRKFRDEQTSFTQWTRMPWHVASRLSSCQHAFDKLLACDAIFIGILAAGCVIALCLLLLLDELSLALGFVCLIDGEGIAVYVVARLLYERVEVAVLLVGVVW
jgi:hypothetical protein